jgi:hypothetical protein
MQTHEHPTPLGKVTMIGGGVVGCFLADCLPSDADQGLFPVGRRSSWALGSYGERLSQREGVIPHPAEVYGVPLNCSSCQLPTNIHLAEIGGKGS